jgi:hypothetical protein
MPLEQGSTTASLGVIVGWELGSELSLGEGLVVGWVHNLASTTPVALHLDGSQSEIFAERGMDVWFGDCLLGAPSPHECTVSHDGTKVVWIDDSGSLMVAVPGRTADDVRVLAGFLGWDVVDALSVATSYPVEGRFLGFGN